MENPIKMDDLGVPLFLEIPIYIYTYTMMKYAKMICMQVPILWSTGTESVHGVLWSEKRNICNNKGGNLNYQI